MALSIVATPPPIVIDDQGTARIGGTRITLDTVITAFKNGASCEEIIYQFPSLTLSDVYAVVSYYLSHRDEVENYMKEREKQAAEIRQQIEALFDKKTIRQRLLKRQARQSR